MPKPVFKPCNQRQPMLLPPDLSDLVPEGCMARVVDAVVDAIDASELYALYPGGGASAYDPKMMLKVVVYAYASGTYSSRKIERATRENVHFMWLCGMAPLDHMTVNRFRSDRIRPVFEDVFAQIVELLADKGLITLETYFIDGTKVEAAANKNTFVWRKSVEGRRDRLREKVRAHLDEIDRINEEEDRLADALPEPGEVTAEDVAEAARRIDERLKSRPKDRGLKRAKKAFEGDHLPRMERYEAQLELFQERNSFSKTDPDATFMRMKEDRAGGGRPKAAYNVQIGTENQFVVASTLHRRPGDTACMIPHLEGFKRRFKALPAIVVADAGYGSEENYAYLEQGDARAFVKHATFHKEQKKSFKEDPTQPKNWSYDAKADEWTCAGGRTLAFEREKAEVSDLGYESTTRIYRCADCSGCPHRRKCTRSDEGSANRAINVSPAREAYRKRAEARLTSDEGVALERRRSTDVETVFGDIKNNWGFKRFTLRGLEKASLEWGLVALGHNMRKLFEAVSRDDAAKQAMARA